MLKLNEHQRSALETFFTLHHFPSKTALKRLAMQTGLSEKQVYHWFGNKRFNTRQGKCEYICWQQEYNEYRFTCQCIDCLICQWKIDEMQVYVQSFILQKLYAYEPNTRTAERWCKSSLLLTPECSTYII